MKSEKILCKHAEILNSNFNLSRELNECVNA